jgi:hypothetical protein
VQQSVVAYDETQKPSLKKALLLGDAISDLPKVSVFSSSGLSTCAVVLLFRAGREPPTL